MWLKSSPDIHEPTMGSPLPHQEALACPEMIGSRPLYAISCRCCQECALPSSGLDAIVFMYLCKPTARHFLISTSRLTIRWARATLRRIEWRCCMQTQISAYVSSIGSSMFDFFPRSRNRIPCFYVIMRGVRLKSAISCGGRPLLYTRGPLYLQV